MKPLERVLADAMAAPGEEVNLSLALNQRADGSIEAEEIVGRRRRTDNRPMADVKMVCAEAPVPNGLRIVLDTISRDIARAQPPVGPRRGG